ncbi:hypothetical protein, partial [Klebsiella pneumoniae]|uniref:hypothetical protein n=1 Tax=Klebsiella pneumoniae TaxID=573 RepID=UPI003C781432
QVKGSFPNSDQARENLCLMIKDTTRQARTKKNTALPLLSEQRLAQKSASFSSSSGNFVSTWGHFGGEDVVSSPPLQWRKRHSITWIKWRFVY